MARGNSVEAGNPFPHYDCGPAADHLMEAPGGVSVADRKTGIVIFALPVNGSAKK
jgi:hypothetical protein